VPEPLIGPNAGRNEPVTPAIIDHPELSDALPTMNSLVELTLDELSAVSNLSTAMRPTRRRASAPPHPRRSCRSRQQRAQSDQVVGRRGEVTTQSTRSPPRCRNLRKPPTVFIQPNTCSISFRRCWLTRYPHAASSGGR
jgi:hypothetical protein